MNTDSSGDARRHGTVEEHPHMGAVPRPRSLQSRRNPQHVSGIQVREGVQRPPRPVEVASQQAARVARLKWVQASMYAAAEMLVDDLVVERNVPLARLARCTPTALHCRTPPRLSRTIVLPSPRVNIAATPEQRPEQCNLLRRMRELMHRQRDDVRGLVELREEARLPAGWQLSSCPAIKPQQMSESSVLLPKPLDLGL